MRRPARFAALALLLSLPALALGTPARAGERELAELDRRLAERVFRILEARSGERLSASAGLGELPRRPERPLPGLPAAPAREAGVDDSLRIR